MGRKETGWALISACIAIAAAVAAQSDLTVSQTLGTVGLVLCCVGVLLGVALVLTGHVGGSQGDHPTAQPWINIDPDLITMLALFLLIPAVPIVLLFFMKVGQKLLAW
jgi:hypothetical protein